MKITAVNPVAMDQYLFVEIETDEGITGLGECGAWGFLEAAEQAIRKFGEYLVGEDPLRIEHHWQVMARWTHSGAAIFGAISALDIAMWDIAGKHFGVPCYQLMGGACRTKARAYTHVMGATTEAVVEGCRDAVAAGFTGVVPRLFPDEMREVPVGGTHARKMATTIARVGAYREAIGDDVDLCLDVHRRLTVAEAVVLIEGIAQFHPFFVEDPIRPDNLDAMAAIAQKVTVPLATGERLHTIEEFSMLLTRGSAQYIRPDICLSGGLTHTKKIAALAEAFGVEVVPHNPLSPVSTAICLQLAAAIPNFAILEYQLGEELPPRGDMVVGVPKLEDGFLVIPDSPGIGIALAEGAVERHPPVRRAVRTPRDVDGSVYDN